MPKYIFYSHNSIAATYRECLQWPLTHKLILFMKIDNIFHANQKSTEYSQKPFQIYEFFS